MAMKDLPNIPMTDDECINYISYLKYQNDMNHKRKVALREGREEGREEGRAEGLLEKAISTAKNFLKMGLSIEQVAQGTGLSTEEVSKLSLA
jgi:predicted transposase/invertase (TIGR01784 family)